MGQDPSTIRREIEQTREEMGDTVDALGYKADVKTRAKENVQDKVGSMKEKITGATPDSGEVKDQARRAAGMAQENPLGLAVGSLAVGFLAGMLIPESKMEHERLGPMADQVKEQVKETGQEALERGKQVAQDAAMAAKDTAQESGQEHAQELKDSAQGSAQDTGRFARESVPGA